MPQVDFAKRSLICKVVYYGPGRGGKTANLKHLHENLPATVRGNMMSLQTETERTLFFDFFPAQLGRIGMFDVRLHFFTVPGQSFYNSTRKSLLQNVDGFVFVADSDEGRFDANIDSLDNLEENLLTFNRKLADIPHVVQYNKRDLPHLVPIEEMRSALNRYQSPEIEAQALTGDGVFETQRLIVKQVLSRVRQLVAVAS